MQSFQFQQFQILQSADVFRVGTDGVLLGALCSVENRNQILEIGTGTGLIALMLAQRNQDANVVAIDIDANAVKLAQQNCRNAVFAHRLQVQLADFNNFESSANFDLLVCNPPFFKENSSEKNVQARQQVSLNFGQLLRNAKIHLKEEGILSVIIPSEFSTNFIELAAENDLFFNKKINIFGIEGGILKRNILEFSPISKLLIEVDFTIEKSPRIYSDQYLEVTKDFHLFSKK